MICMFVNIISVVVFREMFRLLCNLIQLDPNTQQVLPATIIKDNQYTS